MIDPLDIQALVDGELSQKEAESIRAQLAASQQDMNEYHSILSLKQLLSKSEVYTCEVTWAKCQDRIIQIERVNRIDGFVGRYAWGLCGAFAMVILVGGYWTRIHNAGSISSEEVPRVAADMISIPGVSKSVSSVKQWVTETLGRNAPVSLPEGAFQVTSVAKGTIDGLPAAKLGLHDSMGDADLLMVPGAQAVIGVRPLQDREFSVATVDGSSIVSWTRDGCALMMVSRRPVEDLVNLASKVRVQ